MNLSTQTQNWGQIESLFDRLLDLPIEKRRKELVHAQTQYPLEVITEVESLLSKLDDAGDFLEVSAVTQVNLQTLNPGEKLGEWQIEHLIATGGQGQVCRVSRTNPDLKQVGALKIIRNRHISSEVKAFLRERQLLAKLTHPCIPQFIG